MSRTEICVTVTGRTAEAIRAARTAAEADAGMVEVRLDSMAEPDVAAVLADRTKPVVVTCRPTRQGGQFDGPEEVRLSLLREAQAAGAEFIDVESDIDARPFVSARGGRGVVLSHHDFGGVPHDVAGRLRAMRSSGAAIVKFAARTTRLADVRALLAAAATDPGARSSTVLIAMGAAGFLTRALAPRFGFPWTYAGDGVAPGQVPAARLLQEYRFQRVRPDTAVYGVLGRPAMGSLSPAMHNAGFAAHGLAATYVPLETADLDGLRAFAAEIGLRGASVTIPFKRDVIPLLDDLDATASASGAVNTIAIRDGRWIGFNTDGDGFMEPLRRRAPQLAGMRALVLGAGGAARAVAWALSREHASVTLAARRDDAAREVAGEIGGAAMTVQAAAAETFDLIVNATPVGSRAVPGNPLGRVPMPASLIYDLVYDPDPTELMRTAARAGCRTIGGLEMLVAQAERQFEIWTGARPSPGLFQQAADAAVNNR